MKGDFAVNLVIGIFGHAVDEPLGVFVLAGGAFVDEAVVAGNLESIAAGVDGVGVEIHVDNLDIVLEFIVVGKVNFYEGLAVAGEAVGFPLVQAVFVGAFAEFAVQAVQKDGFNEEGCVGVCAEDTDKINAAGCALFFEEFEEFLAVDIHDEAS